MSRVMYAIYEVYPLYSRKKLKKMNVTTPAFGNFTERRSSSRVEDKLYKTKHLLCILCISMFM